MPIRPEMRARYPADWKLRSRFVRFVRARGRCEWCGVPQYAIVDRGTAVVVAGPSPTYAEARQELAEFYASRFGIESDERCPWSIVVLTTAHVYDDRPEASNLLNLAALCQKCHLHHDRDLHKAQRQRNIEQRRGQLRMVA